MNLHTFQRLVRAGKTGLFLLGLVTAGMAYASGDAAVAEAAAGVAKAPVDPAIFYAIAVTMSVGSLSAGFAVGKVGAAAMGAAAEKPELLGKAIAFVGLGEGIALFGFLVSLFLVFKNLTTTRSRDGRTGMRRQRVWDFILSAMPTPCWATALLA